MKIKKFTCINFCQHKDLSVSFHPGVNCIKGVNGSGKSNLVLGISASFTNDFSRNSGNKSSNINFNCDENDVSFIKTEAEHNGVDFSVERVLYPVSAHKFVRNNLTLNKDSEIKYELESFLGVSLGILNDYVFVEQGKIFDFISGTTSNRYELICQLFGTKKVENIWNVLSNLNLFPNTYEKLTDCVRNVEKLNQEIEELNKSNLTLYDKLLETEEFENWMRSEDELYTEIYRIKHYIDKYKRICDLREQLAKLQTELNESNDLKENIVSEYKYLFNFIKNNHIKCEFYLYQQSLWQDYNKYQSNISFLRSEINKHNKDLEDLYLSDIPDNYIKDKVEANKIKNDLMTELTGLEKFLNTFDVASGICVCPLCGSTVDNLSDHIVKSKEKVDQLVVFIKKMEEDLFSTDKYDKELMIYNSRYDISFKNIKRIQDQINSIPVKQKPDENESLCNAFIKEFENIQIRCKSLKEQYEFILKKIENIKVAIDNTNNELNIYSDFQEDIPTMSKKLVELEARLEIKAKKYEERIVAKTCLVNNLETIKKLTETLEDQKKYQTRINTLNKFNNHLEEVRDIFHRSRLPTVIAENYLNIIQKEMNIIFKEFDVDFTIKLCDKLKFVVRFADGNEQPAERLSWGQKTIFALVFRVVVNSMFAGDLGILCLDEPTAGLDDKNIKCLEYSIQKLKELADSRGLQVIIVTHEKIIDNLFDKVIDLSSFT